MIFLLTNFKGRKRSNDKFDTSCYESPWSFIYTMSGYDLCVNSAHKIYMSIFSNSQDIWIITRKWNHNFKLFWKKWMNFMWNCPEGPFHKPRHNPSPSAMKSTSPSQGQQFHYIASVKATRLETLRPVQTEQSNVITLGCYFSRLQH